MTRSPVAQIVLASADQGETVVLDRYDPNGFYCDLTRCEDAAQIRARLAHLSIAELKRRAEHAEAELYNLGITFTVYTEEQAIDRTLPFDVIPRVLSAAEWRVVGIGRGPARYRAQRLPA